MDLKGKKKLAESANNSGFDQQKPLIYTVRWLAKNKNSCDSFNFIQAPILTNVLIVFPSARLNMLKHAKILTLIFCFKAWLVFKPNK